MRVWFVGLAGLLLAACATFGSARGLPSWQGKKPVRLAILPVENDEYPKVADAINEAFKTIEVRAVDEYFRSKVSLDIVQLSIECVAPTHACYAAVGKSLNANMILVAQISRPPKRGKGVRLIVTLLDVDGGKPIHAVERLFKKQDEAVAGVGLLLLDVVNPSSADAGR